MTPRENALAETLFQALRLMDREAVPRPDGKKTGLWWYGGHSRPEIKRPQTEVEWSKRLGELLSDEGYGVRKEVAYPNLPAGRRNLCDLVVETKAGKNLWLELKGAWKDYWTDCGKMSFYRAYLLHPLVPHPAAAKSHSAALDIEKLAQLSPPEADLVGLLLVGFDREDCPMEADVDELIRLGGLDSKPWQSASDSWPDPHRDGRQVRVWFWWRPA